jgi:hypothetical protein
VLRRLPDPWRYRACRHLVIRDPAWYRRVSPFLKVCDASGARDELDYTTLVFDTFDAYSPRYNHVHTQLEVRRWFFEEGFSDVRLTHPIRYRTPGAVARWGECGGAVHVRGVRAPSVLVDDDGPGAAAAVEALAAGGFVADTAAEGRARLSGDAGAGPAGGAGTGPAPAAQSAPAPESAGPDQVLGEAGLDRAAVSVLPFDRVWRDRWHGIVACYPKRWLARPDGAALAVTPPLAIPPFQLGLHLSGVARGRSLADRASAAFARWCPAGQAAEVIADDAFTLAGRPWRRRTYLLRFDTLPAVAHFGYVEHGGRLVQIYALTAWGAGEATRAAAATAFERFCAGLSLTERDRRPGAAVRALWHRRGIATAIGRRVGRRLVRLSGRLAPRQGQARTEGARPPERHYDARVAVGSGDNSDA